MKTSKDKLTDSYALLGFNNSLRIKYVVLLVDLLEKVSYLLMIKM